MELQVNLLRQETDKSKYADYPALLPYEKSRQFFDRELSREERCVRGSYVTGLTEADMKKLDYFEGDVGWFCSLFVCV